MVDLKQFISAIDQIAEEKSIPKEQVVEIIEMALAAAYKKDYGEKGQNIKVKLDQKTGQAKFFQSLLVVDRNMIFSEEELAKMEQEREAKRLEAQKTHQLETGEKESIDSSNTAETAKDAEIEELEAEFNSAETIKKIRFNPKRHILLAEAQKIQPEITLEEELLIPLETKDDYGRIAAQTAKQVIIQRLREAEREITYESFKEKEGEIVSASVQRLERGTVYVDIGKTVGVLFPEEQIPQERYRIGQRLRVYVARVDKDQRGPVIILSRKHPKMIAKLFALEVPEIASGVVEIKAIAREAGSRSKIAVASNDANVDPVGSCVGQKGIRVVAVINELGGENIDVIAWSDNEEKFIANALSPAKVLNTDLNQEQRVATVEVSEDQLSLAIGKKGQNVRLAAILTGWKIDVKGAGKIIETPIEESEKIDEKSETAEITQTTDDNLKSTE